jgi:hypothetical protein
MCKKKKPPTITVEQRVRTSAAIQKKFFFKKCFLSVFFANYIVYVTLRFVCHRNTQKSRLKKKNFLHVLSTFFFQVRIFVYCGDKLI